MADALNNPSEIDALAMYAPENNPSEEEALAEYSPELNTSGPLADHWWSSPINVGSKILNAFGQGYKEGFGTETYIDPEAKKEMLANHTLDDYVSGRASLLKSFNENLRGSLELLAGGLYRFGAGAVTGTESALAATPTPASPVDSSGGHPSSETLGHAFAAIVEQKTTSGDLDLTHINHARANGIIGEGDDGFLGTKPLTDAQKEAKVQAIKDLPPELNAAPPAPPPDIHSVARQVAPHVFDEFDALVQQRDVISDAIDALPREGKVENAPTQSFELAERINQLYNEPTPSPETGGTQTTDLAEGINQRFNSDVLGDNLMNSFKKINQRIKELQPDVDSAYRIAAERTPEAETVTQPISPTEPVSPEAPIAKDVSQKLQAAGRPPEEAEAAGALVQAHYDARASRFDGKLGSGKDLYDRDFPEIVTGDTANKLGVSELGQYIGPDNSILTNQQKANYGIAKTMYDRGESMNKIRRATGWFQNPLDKKWRYEITDQNADLKPAFGQLPESKILGDVHETRLEDILHHSELFEHYPEAKDIKVTKQRGLFDFGGSIQGWFNHETNRLNITPNAQEPLSTLLHEIQHWIQKKEGFATGGNTSTVISKLPKGKLEKLFQTTIQAIENVRQNLANSIPVIQKFAKTFDFAKAKEVLAAEKEAYNRYREAGTNPPKEITNAWLEARADIRKIDNSIFETYFGKKGYFDLSSTEKSIYIDLKALYEHIDTKKTPEELIEKYKKELLETGKTIDKLQQGDIETLQKKIQQDEAYKYYRAIAGEIEARDVQARQNLTTEERVSKEPLSSQTYDPEDVTVNYEQRKGTLKGSLTLRNGKNLLKLFSTADASTFVHETGHQWLEELKQDAEHPQAPESIKNDFQTVKNWLGNKGEDLTRRQHEKFARGFERYLMEGNAPSKDLASVFAKFKDWLTKIYKTVSALRSPITDDIRQVFDRQLVGDKKTVIAPEVWDNAKQTMVDQGFHPDEAEQALSTSGTRGPSQSPTEASTSPSNEGATPLPETQGKPSTEPVGAVKAPPEPEEGPTFNQNRTIKDGKVQTQEINSMGDLSEFMRDIYKEFQDTIDNSRGDKVTEQDIIDFGTRYGMTPAGANRMIKALNNFFVGQSMPIYAKMYAVGKFMDQATADIVNNLVNGKEEEYLDARNRAALAMETFLTGRADWGRTGVALKTLYKEHQNLQTLNEWLKDTQGKTFNQLKEEAKRIELLQKIRGGSPGVILPQLTKELEPSWGKCIQESFINNLISGPITHIAYALGTKMYAFQKAVPQAFLRGLVSEVQNLVTTVKPEERAYMSEAIGGLHSFFFGQADGIRAAGNAIKAGASQSISMMMQAEKMADYEISQGKLFRANREARIADLVANPTDKMQSLGEHPQNMLVAKAGQKAIPGIAGTILRAPGERMVAPIHTSDYVVGLITNLNQLLWRRAIQEGHAPFSSSFNARLAALKYDPPLEDITKAKEEATEQSLMSRQQGAASGLAKFIRSEWDVPLLGPSQPLLYFEPFVGMPSNVLKLMVRDSSPFGIVFKEMREDLFGKDGDPPNRIAQANAMSRMALGTAFWAAAGGYFLMGNLNGGASMNTRQRSMDLMSRGLPHSIRIGDMTYAVDRLGVLGQGLSLAADFFDAIHTLDWKSDNAGKAAAQLIWGIGQHLLNEGPLSGLGDMFDAIENPSTKGVQWAQRFASNLLPYSIGRQQIAQVMDPYMRETKGFLDTIKATIPGLRGTLPARIDIFGQKIPNKDFIGVYAQQVQNDPVVQKLEQLGYFPAPVRDIAGEILTPEQREEFAQKAGLQMKISLNRIILNPNFDNQSPYLQHLKIVQAVSDGRTTARVMIEAKYPSILKDANDKKIKLIKGQ